MYDFFSWETSHKKVLEGQLEALRAKSLMGLEGLKPSFAAMMATADAVRGAIKSSTDREEIGEELDGLLEDGFVVAVLAFHSAEGRLPSAEETLSGEFLSRLGVPNDGKNAKILAEAIASLS